MFRNLAPLVRSGAILLLVLAFGLKADAQHSNQAADSLKAVVAEKRAAVERSDSLGNKVESIEGRLALAPLLAGPDAITALRMAAAMADTSDHLRLELQARSMLATRLASGGKTTEAFAEALALPDLERRISIAVLDSSELAHGLSMGRLKAEQDSLEQLNTAQRAQLSKELRSSEERMRLWMWVALAIAVVALLTLGWLLQRMGRVSKKLHGIMAGLQQEVADLKEFRNKRREQPERSTPSTPPVAVAPPEPIVASPPSQAIVEAMDPVVAALFLRAGPERLATLRAARTSGDREKILRVVHSLKPQLASFDADRFAPICAAITTPPDGMDQTRWNADLDTLERGVENLLRKLAQ